MNIVSDVKAWIVAQLPTLYAAMTIDNFGSTVEALMIRGDPSSAVETEFIDGSTTGSQQVTFYARSKNPATAISALDSIYAKFNQPEITLTGVLCIRVQQVSLPAFVNKEEAGESIYSMTVNVDFDGKNPIEV
jgi:hypothetical protein